MNNINVLFYSEDIYLGDYLSLFEEFVADDDFYITSYERFINQLLFSQNHLIVVDMKYMEYVRRDLNNRHLWHNMNLINKVIYFAIPVVKYKSLKFDIKNHRNSSIVNNIKSYFSTIRLFSISSIYLFDHELDNLTVLRSKILVPYDTILSFEEFKTKTKYHGGNMGSIIPIKKNRFGEYDSLIPETECKYFSKKLNTIRVLINAFYSMDYSEDSPFLYITDKCQYDPTTIAQVVSAYEMERKDEEEAKLVLLICDYLTTLTAEELALLFSVHYASLVCNCECTNCKINKGEVIYE